MTWIHYLILGYIIIGMFWGDYALIDMKVYLQITQEINIPIRYEVIRARYF